MDADVPFAAYAGRLILDHVAVLGGRVTITVSPDGVSNLPGRGGDRPPPAEPRSLALRGLHLSDFAFQHEVYERNHYTIDEQTKKKVYQEWKVLFKEFGYEQ